MREDFRYRGDPRPPAREAKLVARLPELPGRLPQRVESREQRLIGLEELGLEGTPLGRIVGSRVHRFDGTYVGEWYKDMVVRRPQGRPRIIPTAAVPPRRPPAEVSYKLRAVVDYGYPDAFPQLRQGAQDSYMSIAAE